MKTAGIIGGLGAETTAKFYLEMVFGCYDKYKKSRPPILIFNVPQICSVEEEVITKDIGTERYFPWIFDAAKRLEHGGADFLVMPCNSLHIFIEDLRKIIGIPILSIVEETGKFLKQRKISKIGVLATDISIRKHLYEAEFKKIGIEQVLPDAATQEKIGELIGRIVFNEHKEEDVAFLLRIIDDFKSKGAEQVLLACTDLQIALPKKTSLPVHDTMKIFAEATVNRILD